MKLHLFYLISEERLYAYTLTKDYANRFLEERNSNLFIHKKEEMADPIAMVFMNDHKELKLIEYPLTDPGKDLTILATPREDATLTEAIETISSELNEIRLYSGTNVPFKKKWKECISRLTTDFVHIQDSKGIIQSMSLINTFSLFYYLFKQTFNEDSDLIREANND